jgi:hypothetical protein
MVVPARSFVTVSATGTASGIIPPTEASVRAGILTGLSGQFQVASVVIQSAVFDNPFVWNFRAEIVLSAYTNYDSGQIEADVAETIEAVTGYVPSVTVTKVAGQATGSPDQPAIDDGSGFVGQVQGLLGKLSTGALVIGGVLLVAVVVIAFSPQTSKIVKAVR